MFMVVLTGCASGPQLLDENEASQPLAFACRNVDPMQGSFEVDWRDYNTTPWSVLSAALRHSTVDPNPINAGTSILSNMPTDRTYCMVFPEPLDVVASTAYEEIEALGFDFQLSSPSTGEFVSTTREDHDGSQTNLNIGSVKWRETYYVHVMDNIEGGTDLRVFRDIWIARPFEGEWSRYIREQSNGRKEAAILLRVNSRLEEKNYGVAPPERKPAPGNQLGGQR